MFGGGIMKNTMIYTHVSNEAVRDAVRRNPLNM